MPWMDVVRVETTDLTPVEGSCYWTPYPGKIARGNHLLTWKCAKE